MAESPSGDWREIYADWESGSLFRGHSPSGATIQIGSSADQPGVGPMEMLLFGLAGCTGMDIVGILEKKRIKLDRFQVRVRARRADQVPKIWTTLEVTYLLWGEAIPTAAVEDAIRLSEEKYCSVGIMLSQAADLHSSYQILRPGETFSA
jgi:putative redox protein